MIQGTFGVIQATFDVIQMMMMMMMMINRCTCSRMGGRSVPDGL